MKNNPNTRKTDALNKCSVSKMLLPVYKMLSILSKFCLVKI